MPAPETQQEEGRRGGRLLTVVFWIGVGLAPLAALLLLIGGASGLKVAAVLAILAVVLVGLSVMLRPDATSVKVELEQTMLDEIDMLREDVRQDITTAARATHKSFSEKLQRLHEDVEALRGQLGSIRAAGQEPAPAGPPPAAARTASVPAPEPPPQQQPVSPLVAGGVVRHTETVRETTRQTIVDQHGDAERGTVYGGGGTYGRPAEPEAPPVGRRGSGGERSGGERSGGERSGGERSGGERSGGERSERESGRGRSDRGGWAPERDDSGDSWTDQRQREREAEGRGGARAADPRYGSGEYRGASQRGGDYRGGGSRGGGHYRDEPDEYPSGDVRGDEYPSGDVRGGDVRGGDVRGGDVRGADVRGGDVRGGEEARRPRRHDRDDPADDARWSDVRAGDRWAAVRSDEHGREVRMGERRAELRSDESGTELRIEDRWASVRREEGRREDGRRAESRPEGRAEGRRPEYPREDPERGSRHESRYRDSPDESRETRSQRREREERWSAEPSGESRPAGRRARQDDDEASWPRRGSTPALPAAGGPPASSWVEQRRDEPEREPRRRRGEDRGEDRDDRWEREEGGSRGGSRSHRIDFELSDDRWG
ncbi:hypothetical protein GCM10023322_67000 [Rugosimonospora acidiphila]|uniref:Uncharacterized protein n=1 Tax=Rugosimonospora acidiphila TaxID=556531 RepID=A0ABP9SL29_9ACTN